MRSSSNMSWVGVSFTLFALLPTLSQGRSCFTGAMRVHMADKSLKAIKDIKPGDRVLSYDLELEEVVEANVIDLIASEANELMKLEMETGSFIWSTPDHPYYSFESKQVISLRPDTTASAYRMEAVQMRQENEPLMSETGSLVLANVTDLVHMPDAVPTYTLRLEPTHWFFVEGVLVHNKGSSGGFSSGSSSLSGSSSSSRTYYTSSGGGSYYISSSGYYISNSGYSWATLVYFRSSYYSRSSRCSSYPTDPGCQQGTQENLICGCSEGLVVGNSDSLELESSAVTTATVQTVYGYDPCPADANVGVCISEDWTGYCVPVGQNFTRDDGGWAHVQYYIDNNCLSEYMICEEDDDCAPYLSNSTNEANYYLETVLGAPANYSAFQTCMNTNLEWCPCEWEVCDTSGGISFIMIAGIVLFGICFIAFPCIVKMFCACARRRFGKSSRIVPVSQRARQVIDCFGNRSHTYELQTPQQMADRRNDQEYLKGYYCDRCDAFHAPPAAIYHCNICLLDYCAKCSQQRGEQPQK